MKADSLPDAVECFSLSGVSNLCETCMNISFDSILDAIPQASYPKGGGCGIPNFFEFSIKEPLAFPDVQASASSCALCALIVLQGKNARGPIASPLELAALIPPTRDTHPGVDRYQRNENEKHYSVFGEPQPQWHGLKSGEKRVNTMEPVTERSGSRGKTTGYEIYSPWQVSIAADAGTLACKYVTRRPLAEKGSEKSFESLLKPIQNCDLNHPRCHLGVDGRQMAKTVVLPTRVIDVGSLDPPRHPRLIISNGQRGQYATLSHCWGSQRWVATTNSSLPRMLDGFALDSIPKTYADAITVARKLGLQYLWIDSFCIIQDDRDDWRRESQLMGEIYENSYCNIAATGAEDGRTGFLSARKEELMYVRVPSSNAEGYVYFCNQANSDFQKYVLDARVNTRGWVLQERILSRRTIHFAEDQWYWECGEHTISEDGWQHETQGPPDHRTPSLRASLKESTMPIGKIFKNEEEGTRIFFGDLNEYRTPSAEVLWAQVLRSYSNCHLTFASDKIPALHGLASKFSDVMCMRYYFGHWIEEQSPLPLSLMWFAAGEGGLVIPAENRAPTWSCLKGDGPLGFHDCRGAVPCTRVDELQQDSDTSLPDDTSIILRGTVRKAKRAFQIGSDTTNKGTFYSMSFTSKTAYGTFTNTLGPANFDNADNVPEEFTLLLTFEIRQDAKWANQQMDQLALVLQEVEDGGEESERPIYRRIGIANINNHNFFREGRPVSLRII